MALTITDPIYDPARRPGFFEKIAGPICARYLVDSRDFPFLKLIFLIMFSVIPFAIFLFAWQEFPIWVGCLYLALVLLYFLGPVILMLHNTSHRPLLRKPYGKVINKVMGIFIYPFFGEVSASYFSHHMGMHHVEGNLKDDLSTTMFSQRDSFWAFLKYVGKFYVLGLMRLLKYLKTSGRTRLYRKTLIAEFGFYAVVTALAFFNFKATLFVFIIPFVVARFAMMAGNWAQHAFIDPEAPQNIYRNSITCINSTYNRRCFNDGYHIGHHLTASRHWMEMPTDFLQNQHLYFEERAIVFEGLDYFQIWILLMLKKYNVLAKHLVNLGGANLEQPVDLRAKIQLLKERTSSFSPEFSA